MEAYVAADPEEQSRLLRAFEVVRENPEKGAQLVGKTRDRDIWGRWFGNWLVLYYLDHPIRAVVLIDCQWT